MMATPRKARQTRSSGSSRRRLSRACYERTLELQPDYFHGRFIDVSDQSGNGLKVRLSSRGAAFDDLDDDGNVDVVVLNSREKPTVLRNDTPGRARDSIVILF